MDQPQLKWKKAAAPRAKPIPAQKWEKHKDELCELYQKMTLEDLMAMMKVKTIRHMCHREQGLIDSSRRQYISQMERWGIQKYNKSGAQKATTTLGGSLHDQNIVRTWEERPLPDFIPRQGSAKRELSAKPEVPPKKRQKLSNFIAEKAYNDLAMAFERMSPSCEDLGTANKNSPQPLTMVNTTAAKASRVTPPVSVNLAKTTDEQASTQILGDGNDGADVIVDEDCDNNEESDSSEDSESSEESEKDDDTGDVVMGYSQEAEQFDLQDDFLGFNLDYFNSVKVAADFAFAAKFRADSFNLYVLMLQRLNILKDAPLFLQKASKFVERMTVIAIIGCARSATTASQLQVSINLLEQQLSQRPIYAEDTTETFLYRSLLEQSYKMHGMTAEADFQQRLASRLSCVTDKTLLQQPNCALSLLDYFYLDHALSRGQFIASHNLKAELITARPGLFEYHSGRMQNTSIRDCLEWCLWKLQNRSIASNAYFQNNPFHCNKFLGLFSDLWPGWKDRMMDTFSSRDLSCAGQIEKDLGISPTEFLAIICDIILKEAPLISPMELTSISGPLSSIANNWNGTTLRAVSGVKSLLGRSDWALANVFLKGYSGLNSECYSKDLVLNPTGRWELKSFLEVKLDGMELPNLPEFDQLHLESHICSRDGAAYSQTNLAGLFTTLNPSLSSVTFFSLQALKDRIETGAIECIDALDTSLPSRMMRNSSSATSLDIFARNLMRGDSQSLLSATSSNEIEFSALDTLASVSACVRYRFTEIE